MKKTLIAALLMFSVFARAEDALHVENLKPLSNAEKISGANQVLLYFWASWCPDCREKLSHGELQALQRDFPKIKILTVNADREESRGKNFSDSEKLTLPVYRDDEKTLAKTLKLFAVPAWAILEKSANGQWTVRKSSTGSDISDMRSELTRML
jgi:thiol-disulfide isomerase/thioredoxin